MAKYKISGATRPQLVQHNIERADMGAAIKAFRAKAPNAEISSINGREVVAFDEGDGRPIFEGDKYATDPEGCSTLIKRGKRGA